jgi:hypothetical protein
LTPVLAKLSISPESSDGFASVGTILPKKRPPCCRVASSLFVGVRAGEKKSTVVLSATSILGRTATFTSGRAGEGRGVADRESVESVNALPLWRDFRCLTLLWLCAL